MPYIDQVVRAILDSRCRTPNTVGELNYCITQLVKQYQALKGLRYQTINDVLGALEGAKQEYYRRVAIPYENAKMAEYGDVYD